MMRLRGDSARRYKDLSLISSCHIKGQTKEHAKIPLKSHCIEGWDRPIPGTCWPASPVQSASPICQWGTVSQKTRCTYPSWGIISDGGFQPTHTCQMTEDMEGRNADTTLSQVTSLTQVHWCLSTDPEWNTEHLDEEHSQDKCKCPSLTASFREWSGGRYKWKEWGDRLRIQDKAIDKTWLLPQVRWKCTRETCSTPFKFYLVHILLMSVNVGIYVLQYTCRGQGTTLWGLGSNLSQQSCA